MERGGKKSRGGRKSGAGAAASGKKSNTKTKQGSQRGGRAGTAALSVPFGIVAPSTAKPDAFPTEEFYDGPPVASVKALRPTLHRLVFDPDLWLRAFEHSGGRFGRRRTSSLKEESKECEPDHDDKEEADKGATNEENQQMRDDDESNDEPEDVDENGGDDDKEEDEVVEEEESEEDKEEDDVVVEEEGEEIEEDERDEEEEKGSHGSVESRFNSAKLKQLRQIVQIGTIDAVLRGKYFLADRPTEEGQEVIIREVRLNKKAMQKAASATRMYASDHIYPLSSAPKKPGCSRTPQHKTEILVVEGDCLEAALVMKHKRGLNPAVLNMASRSNPGGGYRHGTGAQEENITRRSNLFQCLEDPYRTDAGRQWSYPLPEFGGIYTPDATIFRRSEAAGYAFLEEPQYLSIISVSAYSNPPVEEIDGELRLSGPAIVNNFKKKIKAILNIALDNGHESVVLGAFGCGVHGNPPKHIAQLFGEVLRKDFAGRFEMVVFAIIDGSNTFQWFNPQGNVLPFAQAFKCEALTLEELAERIAKDVATKPSDNKPPVAPPTTTVESVDGTVMASERGKRRRRRAAGKGSTKTRSQPNGEDHSYAAEEVP